MMTSQHFTKIADMIRGEFATAEWLSIPSRDDTEDALLRLTDQIADMIVSDQITDMIVSDIRAFARQEFLDAAGATAVRERRER